jgi:homocysteine S-methyltransferase
MRDPIDNFLRQSRVIILDGALATELESRGADLKDPLWSARCLIERPQLIREVHLDYFRAGADVATTATYQASFEGFAQRGIDRATAQELMRSAVTLARSARDEFWSCEANRAGRLRPLIAASVGPYGAMLADGSEYRGDYRLDDAALADFHRPRLQILADAGADLLACETIPCLREARVLAHLLRDTADTPAWFSFSCKDGAHNCAGEEIGACVAQFQDHPQVVAVGVNCTAPQYIPALLRRMRMQTGKPLLVYPNSGEIFVASSRQWTGQADARFADDACRWYSEGARLIGGCCRTTPSDIRDLRQCTHTPLHS